MVVKDNAREAEHRHAHMSSGGGCSRTLALTVGSAAIGGTFQYGYNISIINAPTASIQRFINDTYRERWGAAPDAPNVTLLWTLIVSAFPLGGLGGALLAGPMALRFGRKRSLLLNNVFPFAGAALVLASRRAGSYETVAAARLLVGVGAGVSMNVQPMYLSESAPTRLRGAAAFSSAVFTALGIFLGQVAGLTELLGAEDLWPYLLASNAVPAVLQLLTLPWFPESPRYLLMDRGDEAACVLALARLRGGVAPAEEMEEMLEEMRQQQRRRQGDSGSVSPWALLKDRTLRPQLRTVMAASGAMMLCGNDAIYSYASSVFREAGVPADELQYACLGTGLSEFAAAVASNLLIERAGRRRLLVGGYGLMAVFAAVFTLALALRSLGAAGTSYLSAACVFAYILSFGAGPAGVTGILPAEIFDQASRPAAYALAGSLMWIALLLTGAAFPFVVAGLGSYCFVPFGAVCAASALFLGSVLPETKGRTLAEITAEFERKGAAAAAAAGGRRQAKRGGDPAEGRLTPGTDRPFTPLEAKPGSAEEPETGGVEDAAVEC